MTSYLHTILNTVDENLKVQHGNGSRFLKVTFCFHNTLVILRLEHSPNYVIITISLADVEIGNHDNLLCFISQFELLCLLSGNERQFEPFLLLIF